MIQKTEVEALGMLSAELASRADAWNGNAPEWFPEPPEWLELWAAAKQTVIMEAAAKLIGQRVAVFSVSQEDYGNAVLRPVFGQRIGILSDVGARRLYLDGQTFSAPWKMIDHIEAAI